MFFNLKACQRKFKYLFLIFNMPDFVRRASYYKHGETMKWYQLKWKKKIIFLVNRSRT